MITLGSPGGSSSTNHPHVLAMITRDHYHRSLIDHRSGDRVDQSRQWPKRQSERTRKRTTVSSRPVRGGSRGSCVSCFSTAVLVVVSRAGACSFARPGTEIRRRPGALQVVGHSAPLPERYPATGVRQGATCPRSAAPTGSGAECPLARSLLEGCQESRDPP